ncbi:MAG: potassium transporter KefA [Firmicutes bacterium HGW-Firmicutes-11]|jgi:trk system potassium uptake protein TrkH|nr:MAG: potassium transporter KefA [Firmicutes bacterium HGW-Firmicutes-11]
MAFNYRLIFRVTAMVILLLAVAMVPAMFVSLLYGERDTALAFLGAILPTAVVSLPFVIYLKPLKPTIHIRDGFLIVSLSWIIGSLFGALPFLISGAIPGFADAFFESASGFTTTGASILSDVEVLPRGILFWRSFTHWLGGMGILIFAIALFPSLKLGSFLIAKAEAPGPSLDKLTPKLSDSAKLLYYVYTGMTIAEVLLLMLGGLDLFDAMIHTFGTVATGGFSSYNASIAHFDSLYVEMVVVVFMILAGTNFNLYFLLLRRNMKGFLADREWRTYMGVIVASFVSITFLLNHFKIDASIGESMRLSIFQTVTILTTTGFATADFSFWPTTCLVILLVLMFIGGCSGSTSGAMKSIRFLVLFKLIKRGIKKRLHPNAVVPIKLAGKNVASDRVSNIASFIFTYLLLFVLGALVVSLEGTDLVTAISASAACLGNIGPGFGEVGPMVNYGFLSAPTKLFLSMMMIAGRLELFTILLLFTRTFWNPDR